MNAQIVLKGMYDEIEIGEKFRVETFADVFEDVIAIEHEECLMCIGLPRGSQKCSRLPPCSRMSFVTPDDYALLRLKGKV